MELLYIAGTGYSGSTLLSLLLDNHPDIATVSEATGPHELVADHHDYNCSCGVGIADCPFWKRVYDEMKQRGFDFGPNRWDLRYRLSNNPVLYHLLCRSLRNNTLDALRDALVFSAPVWGERMREISRRNVAFMESVLAVTGRRVFLDASKDPMRPRYFHRVKEIDQHVVHLVRDPRGYVSSMMNNAAASLETGIRGWNRMEGHATRLEALLGPERFTRLRYEDLCTDPEAELERIFRFAGLKPHPGASQPPQGEYHIIGNRMRLTAPRQLKLDEKWRERLSEEQVQTIEDRTREARERLGYA